MKKIVNLLLIFIVSFTAIACMNEANNIKADEPIVENQEYGTAELKMFIPDYYLMAETETGKRAVAPQTAYVQLSAYNSATDAWNVMQKVSLEGAECTSVENAPEGFSGSVYTLVFSKVYAKTYAAGALKVDLMSASGVVLTSGTNNSAVTVKKGKNATTAFYTIPSDYSKSESSLSSGEMKFCRFSMKANTHYTLHMDVTGTSYPDIVVFNEDGTLSDYYAIDDADSCIIDFPADSVASTKYVGVWADDGTYVSKYSINLYTDLTDFTFKDSSIGFWGGENYQINLTPVPSDAYLGNPTYTSDNEKITVSEKGVISGSEEAEGTITVTYEGISHTIAVNVYESATELSGVLSGENLHWTKENSPYKVTGDCLVEEDDQLIIDAGVKVYFTGNNYIKMNGSIYAVGTKDEPIVITKAASYSGYWDGLRIGGGSLTIVDTYQYSSGNILKYVDFSYANTPVTLSNATYVDHCKFIDCSSYVYVSSNSVLINNDFEGGVNFDYNSPIVANNIINNVFSIQYASITATNNTINNARISLSHYYDYIHLTNNVFNGGSWNIGCEVNRYYVQNNNFLNYSGIIISVTESHDSYKQTHFTGNYWGESQTKDLIKNEETGEKNVSFIYDYRDNFNYTEVDYSDWVREPIENAGYQGDGFIAFDYTVNGYNWNNGGCYPESTDAALTIAVTPLYNENNISFIRVAQGYDNLLAAEWQTYTGTVTFTADKTALVDNYAPIYVQLKDSEGNISASLCHSIPFDSPVITCSIADGTVYKNPASQVQWTWTFSDNSRLMEYIVYVDGINVRSDSTSQGWDENPITRDDNYIGVNYMASGDHTILIKVWDIAGNLTTKEITFTVTNTSTDISSLAGISWDSSTGQPLKDSKTSYLWHLDGNGEEVNVSDSTTAASYTEATGGLGSGCAGYVNFEVPFKFDKNAFTIEAFVHAEEGRYPAVCARNNESIELYTDYGYMYFVTSSGNKTTEYFNYPSQKSNGDWQYLVFVYDGNCLAKYVNGNLVSYHNGIVNKLVTSTNNLGISFENYDAVDEVRISNAARSADEIKAYYDCAKEKIQ